MITLWLLCIKTLFIVQGFAKTLLVVSDYSMEAIKKSIWI